MMVYNFSIKNEIKRAIFVVLIVLLPIVSNVFAADISTSQSDKVLCVTIPKSGTHLLSKCITLLDIPNLSYEYQKALAVRYLKNLNDPIPQLKKDFITSLRGLHRHLPHSPEAEKFIAKRTCANFFMLRDPRAQMVSLAKTIQKSRVGGKKREMEELLLDFILAREENFLPSRISKKFQNVSWSNVVMIVDLAWKIGLYEFYTLFIPWMKAEKFYTIRFENLVGPNGGGSKERQYQEIQNIAHHLGVSLSEQKITEVAENLFGGTATFSSGQIDSWKQYFTPRVKEAFKADKRLMQLLIDLRYENDANW